VKQVQQVERKAGFWPIRSCGEPPDPHELLPFRDTTDTIAIVDIDVMNSVAIKDDEVRRSSQRTWTFHPSVAKLNTYSEVLQFRPVEKGAIPLLFSLSSLQEPRRSREHTSIR